MRGMVVLPQHIVTLAHAFSAATGVSVGAVSHRVFDDSKKIPAMEGGADITVRRYNMAVRWFSENWPADTAWPADIPRGFSRERDVA